MRYPYLRLLQHRPDLLIVAIEHDVDLAGLLHLLQDQLVVVVVLEVELLHHDPRVVLVSRGVVEQLLQPHKALVVLVDGQGSSFR